MEEASYVVFLARACRGLFAGAVDDNGRPITVYEFIRDFLHLSQGNALIHAASILEGNVMVWPDRKLSRIGRWWNRVVNLIKSRRPSTRSPQLGRAQEN